ncbi:MAG: polysaccharide deacetylase family protein [Akkermansia sp.]|nr:polysaccharide deacetylase family protein [Akkermansia sp.]
MKALLRVLVLTLCAAVCAQEFGPQPMNLDPLTLDAVVPVAEPEPPMPLESDAEEEDYAEEVEPEAQEALDVPRDQTRVAVLGYHNFSKTAKVTQMLMRTGEFREQMEYLRRAGITVISMQEFLEWRLGTRTLPARCALITLDDGWKSVYTDAYPILKEYGYPFTLFLYTKYLTGLGDSLKPEQVKEMQANGATIGSHSVSHLYPSSWKKTEKQGPEAYAALVDAELGESQKKLSEMFGPVNTYCYPGGYVTPGMLERMPGYGYVAAFTVLPGKVTVTEDPLQIHRYMIFGNDSSIFRRAVDFRVAQLGTGVTTGASPGTLPADTPAPPFAVYPKPQETVAPDLPEITAYLSGVAGVDISTVQMKVSGFGRVPAKVDEATRTVQWVLPCRIYMPNLSVHVTWKSTDGKGHKAEWSFSVDPNAPIQTENTIP